MQTTQSVDQEIIQFRDTADLEGVVLEVCFLETNQQRELEFSSRRIYRGLSRVLRSQEAILTEVRAETELILSKTARSRPREEKGTTRALARIISLC